MTDCLACSVCHRCPRSKWLALLLSLYRSSAALLHHCSSDIWCTRDKENIILTLMMLCHKHWLKRPEQQKCIKKRSFGLCKTHNWVNNHCALYDQIRVQMSSKCNEKRWWSDGTETKEVVEGKNKEMKGIFCLFVSLMINCIFLSSATTRDTKLMGELSPED